MCGRLRMVRKKFLAICLHSCQWSTQELWYIVQFPQRTKKYITYLLQNKIVEVIFVTFGYELFYYSNLCIVLYRVSYFLFCACNKLKASHIYIPILQDKIFELENIISVAKCILVTLILLFFGNLTNIKLYYNNLQKCHNT